MKKLFFFAAFALGLPAIGLSQQKTEGQTTERMKIYHAPTQTENEQTVEEQILICEQHLEALDVKEAEIRSNPEEYQIALENGWFEEAEATRQELRAKIERLKQSK